MPLPVFTVMGTSSYPLYAIEVCDTASGDAPRLLMRGSDDPFTFTTYESAARVISAGLHDVPHARVVGLGVLARFPWS